MIGVIGTGLSPAPCRRSLARRAGASVGAAAALCLAGCATVPRPTPADPWEGWNRSVQRFNDALDDAVLLPVARAYRDVVPSPVRTGVGNFFNNLADIWSAANHLLQGKVEPSFTMATRFGLNSTFGLLGLIDVASDAGLERQPEDLGQTLGRWGIGPGPYVVWPILGPSDVRDSVALPIDFWATSTARYGMPETGVVWAYGLELVHVRSTLIDAAKLLDAIALDRYTFLRDAYLARRRNLVYDGEPPEPADDVGTAPPGDAPSAPAVPAPAVPAATAK